MNHFIPSFNDAMEIGELENLLVKINTQIEELEQSYILAQQETYSFEKRRKIRGYIREFKAMAEALKDEIDKKRTGL